jgi:hypothetical protein
LAKRPPARPTLIEWVEKGKAKDRSAPKEIWQNTHQQNMLSVFPLKSPNYIFENTVSPPIQALPPITPLLGVHEEREKGEAKAIEHLPSSSPGSMPPPPLKYSYRVEDVSISPNGDRIVQAAYHPSLQGVRLGNSDMSWGYGREKWQVPFESR